MSEPGVDEGPQVVQGGCRPVEVQDETGEHPGASWHPPERAVEGTLADGRR
ncbi:hypothetical protein [Streptomyces sp. NPDC085479]|uniref:hypothetical protein n=1 Tax=Streptomyces sp. NPDC085479 TaxID=3365726 RepID=UPI0037D1F710